MTTEVRCTSATGGQKGRKLEEFALLPVDPLTEVARVYGYGAQKYSPGNYLKGYPWSWSTSALLRHIFAFLRGESIDPESGRHHLALATFHLFALMEFERRQIGEDDRMFKREPPAPPAETVPCAFAAQDPADDRYRVATTTATPAEANRDPVPLPFGATKLDFSV